MRERRNHLILVSLILAALIGAALLAVPGSPIYKKPVLGLDLQGGVSVVLEAVPPAGRPLTDADLDRSVEIMRDRVDKLGVAEPEIRKQPPNQIVIELPGVKTDDVEGVIGKTAQLEFFDLQADLLPPSIDPQGFPLATETLYDLLNDTRVKKRAEEQGASTYYLFDVKEKKLLKGPVRDRDNLLRTGEGASGASGGEAEQPTSVPASQRILAVPKNAVVVICGPGTTDFCPGVNEPTLTQTYFYLFKFDPEGTVYDTGAIPEMTGKHLRLTGTRADFSTDPRTQGEPIVSMQFTDEGADKFHEITRREATRGQTLYNTLGQGGDHEPFNQNFAIVLDRELRSFPSIDFREYPDGISGSNGAQITFGQNSSIDDAKELALVLQTGTLPVEFKTLEQTTISATLGEDSLREALWAAIAGMVIVAIFLLIFYRFLGLVAVLGLGIYAVFLYVALLLFSVTLTLPGFAGMILTIGVAADANIVIFERIKEESRAGKSVRAAIGAGYSKGFLTIVDANVVTAITALVLFALATAGVKGFALMLLIGTAMSMITAVFATRAMLGLLSGFRWFNSPRFMGAGGQQTARWLQIDFMGKRVTWFAISGAVVAIAVGTLALKGLNLGIDFEGGTQMSWNTPRAVALEDVRAEAARVGEGDAQIQGRGEESAGQAYREFQLRVEEITNDERISLERALTQQFDAENFGTKAVSASFGSQVARSAIQAVLISFLLIVIYMSIRFQWKFSVPVLVAIVHDVLITVGVYAFTGREVTTATVAAVLTVLGYSMYDTIIIFDRIRENIPLMRRSSFSMIANVSIWETIRRSLATTFITLLPITSLLLFGGETLKDFAFALLVGIGSGAYSTIFIASPLLTIWKEREPEYAAKKKVDTGKDGTGHLSAGDHEGEAILVAAAQAAAAEPTPELVPAAPMEVSGDGDGARSKREQRRQRRRSRPHGRPR